MSAFVVEYHLTSGDYRVTEYPDRAGRHAALERRMAFERAHSREDGWEVVSLHAQSLDAIKVTHSRYFQGQELPAAS
jgi:hypothetical protein